MSLVQYPDSDVESDEKDDVISPQPSERCAPSTVKRKRSNSPKDSLPPLPAAFHDLYSTNARGSTCDNPSLHGGRKRAVPHIEGNWPSHIYLEWIPSQAEAVALYRLIQHVEDTNVQQYNKRGAQKLPVPKIVPSFQSELGAPLPLHVSLSRTLQIKTDDRETFVETLRSSVRRAGVHAFSSRFRSLKWVPNFERNRWFLVLSIEKPAQDGLNKLLKACNEAAKGCGHPGLYTGGQGDGPMEVDPTTAHAKRKEGLQGEDDSVDRSDHFHVSVAWNLEEPDVEMIASVLQIDVGKFIQSPQVAFDSVKARVGNVVHNISLGAKRTGLGLGGSA